MVSDAEKLKSHSINIRIDYKDDDAFEVALWRFRLGLLECLKSQTSKNFIVAARSQERHFSALKELGEKYGVEIRPYLYTGGDTGPAKYGFVCIWPFSETKYLDKYHIQTILDHDDWVSPGFVARIEKEFSGKTKKHLLNFLPIKVDVIYLEIYKLCYYEKHGFGSGFLSIFCPDLNDYTFCWETVHLRMPGKIGSATVIPEGYCWYVIHNRNISSGRKKSSTVVKFPLNEQIAEMKEGGGHEN